jgi:hypothetical protein
MPCLLAERARSHLSVNFLIWLLWCCRITFLWVCCVCHLSCLMLSSHCWKRSDLREPLGIKGIVIPFFSMFEIILVIWLEEAGSGNCCIFLISFANRMIMVACLVGSLIGFLFFCLTFLMCFFAAFSRASLIFP